MLKSGLFSKNWRTLRPMW